MTSIERLKAWLRNELPLEYKASRTHDLHLWDWEVYELLKDLTVRDGEGKS